MEQLSADSRPTLTMVAVLSLSLERTSVLSLLTPGCLILQNSLVSNCKIYLSQTAKCISLKFQNVFVAIAGEDFCVIASDTRLSGHGYAILSREQPKLFKLSETTVLGSTGCWCDILTFCKVCYFSLSTLGGTLKAENLKK